ncbi:hypothetical protein GPECTOR_22g930 [Gonium pectorale]|uniref:Fe2OG dioxygenase domain-containing protein n=1 Tax=Gonium pectorale TaxID=33097 RepID=A0A150GHN2_GONPE|nr:hypothetical protein GPECTOR_22g930 [Gonium pectorale]|eukprot:KXZ49336.1 hypothetical protein GPECTOR_22g930 [Gonium pectorale]
MEATVSLNQAGDGVEVVVLLPPELAQPADVAVEVVGDDALLVQTAGGDSLQVPLPIAVDPDTGSVKLRRATGRLTFRASAAKRAVISATTAGANGGSGSNNGQQQGASSGPPPMPPMPVPVPLPQESPKEEAAGAQVAATAPTAEAPAQPTEAAAVAAAAEALAAAPLLSSSNGDLHGPTANGSSHGAAAPTPSTAAAAAPSGGRSGSGSASGPAAAALSAGPAAARAPPLSLPKHASAPPPPPPRSPGAASVGSAASADDAALYADFFCNSPPAMPAGARAAAAAEARSAPTEGLPSGSSSPDAAASDAPPPPSPAAAKAAKLADAFTPTDGTSSRAAGFSFTAPELPPPPPLPPGLPPTAPPIDCRYLAVANGLRVSAHAPTAAMAELLGLRPAAPSPAAARRQAERVEAILGKVAATLDAYGYAVLDNYISDAAILAARKELSVMEPHYSPGLIWVGSEAEAGAQIAVGGVRGDVVLWLDDAALNATAFVKDGVRRDCGFMQLQQLLADVDELVFEGLRPRLPYLAGLHRRSDAMMAIYPGKGARFAKHVDNTTGDGRRLTVLTYLNPGWEERQGGALRLFPVRQGAAPVVDVPPLAGRVALFLSAEVAHEVLPAFARRHAVTLWYFDAGEHAAALTAARVMPGASSRPSAQAAATALLRDLLADEATSGIEPTPEGCAALGTRVAALEAGAQQLLAAVLGLPSTAALVEAMRALTPDSLRRRREELRNMGLGTQHHAPDTSSYMQQEGRTGRVAE